MKLEEKKQIAEDLHGRFKRSQLVVLTDFKGLDVGSVSDLRRKLKEAGVEYKVVKNTLMARASQDTPVAVMADHFKGPGAVAISYQDPVAPAKILTKFADDSKKLEIRAAVLNGKLIDVNGVKALAALPSREVLLGQLLSVMAGVPTSAVRVLAGVPRALVNLLSALKDKRQAAEAPPVA
ncbi:MAG TPA: 50S ribosomal protein L10 [Desulfobacterales bacterium]|nr:50S ribosomal protein L10 [Desulfobacterales bacterium]